MGCHPSKETPAPSPSGDMTYDELCRAYANAMDENDRLRRLCDATVEANAARGNENEDLSPKHKRDLQALDSLMASEVDFMSPVF